MDKKFCFDALAEEGFQPEIDEDGDISFLAGEISLSLILDEEDKDFFSLVCAFEVDDMDQLELFYSNLRRYVELLLDMQESVFDACEEDDSDAE